MSNRARIELHKADKAIIVLLSCCVRSEDEYLIYLASPVIGINYGSLIRRSSSKSGRLTARRTMEAITMSIQHIVSYLSSNKFASSKWMGDRMMADVTLQVCSDLMDMIKHDLTAIKEGRLL